MRGMRPTPLSRGQRPCPAKDACRAADATPARLRVQSSTSSGRSRGLDRRRPLALALLHYRSTRTPAGPKLGLGPGAWARGLRSHQSDA